MKITKKPMSELRTMEKNVRRHTDKQMKEYVRSIEMFGVFKPLVIDETGLILAGNGLYYALKSMSVEECDCYVMTGLTEAQKKKLMLADNRVYELGITDTAIFDDIIRELDGDIDVPGWDADLLEMLNASVKDANDMVNSYGVYGDQAVANVSGRERVEHTDQAPAQTPLVATADVTAETGAAAVQTERVVICPKCGERICL